jgi:hypothetical protein
MDKRVVVFDIHGLGTQLKPTGLLVITDTMLNRVTLNWKMGKRTHVFIDEFHVVFENEFSAQSSTPRGDSSVSATLIRPPSRRMWNTFGFRAGVHNAL